MRSASSRPLWLLVSAAVAFGVLAWSAQRPQAKLGRILVRVHTLPQAGSATTSTNGPAGMGFFRRQPVSSVSGAVVSGVDTFTANGGSTSCLTSTWKHGRAATATVTPCSSGTVQWQLRKLP